MIGHFFGDQKKLLLTTHTQLEEELIMIKLFHWISGFSTVTYPHLLSLLFKSPSLSRLNGIDQF